MRFLLLILLIIVPVQAFAASDGNGVEYVKSGKNLGVGTKTPQANLHVNGTTILDNGNLIITTTTPTNGYVLTTDANGLVSWASAASLSGAGDDLGNHTATTTLNLSSNNISNVGNIDATTFNGGTFNGTFLGNGNGLEFNGNTIRNANIVTSTINGTLDFLNGTILQTTTTSNPILWDANLEFSGDLTQQAGYVFQLYGAPSGSPQVAFYSNNGEIGINTTSPSTDFDVNGQIMIRGGSPGNGKILASDANGLASWIEASTLNGANSSTLGGFSATDFLKSNGSDIYTTGTLVAATGTTLKINGSLAITSGTPASGKVLTSDASGNATWQTVTASGTPAGSNGEIQFNLNNTFNASSDLYWDNLNSYLAVGHGVPDTVVDLEGFLTIRSDVQIADSPIYVYDNRNGSVIGMGIDNLDITAPPSLVQGELMLAFIASNEGSTVNVTPPSGWTELTTSNATLLADVTTASIFYKVVTASEPGSYTFTFDSVVTEGVGDIIVYNNGTCSNPIVDYAATSGTYTFGVSAQPDAPALNASFVDNYKIIRVGVIHDLYGGFIAPAGYTQQAYIYGGGGTYPTFYVFDKEETGPISTVDMDIFRDFNDDTSYSLFTIALGNGDAASSRPAAPDNGATVFWHANSDSVWNDGDFVSMTTVNDVTKEVRIIDFNNGRLATDSISSDTTFNGLTLNGLTASSLVTTDANKKLASVSALTIDGSNLGIGISSTSAKLHVNGAVLASTFNGTYYGDGSNLTGVGSKWTDTGTVTYLTDLSDNVGIGTTTPSALLEVNGFALIGDSANNVTAIGGSAASSNSGTYVVALGKDAAKSNSGSYINALGWRAAENNTVNSINAIGNNAGQNNIGVGLNALGNNAGSNNNGQHLNAIGLYAAQENLGGFSNIIGYNAGQYNTADYVNAIGFNAGTNNIGSNLIAIGYNAGKNNNGGHLYAFGATAGSDNTGTNLNALGQAVGSNNTGNYVNAIGYYTGNSNRANYVDALGYQAAQFNNGDYTNAIGHRSAQYNSGAGNIALGRSTLRYSNGDYNIAIGYQAGMNLNNGAENILIGHSVEALDNNGSYQLNIGDTIYGDLANGNVGIGYISPEATLDVNGTSTVNGTLTLEKSVVFDELVSNTSATNVTVDWTNGNRQSITLGHNVTFTFTAPAGVAHLTLFLYQDGTGSRTVTWPATVKWPADTAPTLTTTASDLDIVTCIYDGSTNYYCQAGLGFSP